MVDPATIGYSLEGLLVLAGLVILIVHFLKRRRDREPPILRLAPRHAFTADLLFPLVAFVIPMALSWGAATLAAKTRPDWGVGKIQLGAMYVLEFGMIAVIAVYLRFWGADSAASPPPPKLPALRTGVLTFLAAMPLVVLVGIAWQGLLTLCNFPPAHQTIVEMFLGLDTPLMQFLFTVIAVVLVPFNEEMIFRGGLFRGLRGALPRPYAILISAVVFAGAHGDLTAFLPLVALGAIFALAYERTGNIGTVIVAHGLFNLNTLVALLLGVNT